MVLGFQFLDTGLSYCPNSTLCIGVFPLRPPCSMWVLLGQEKVEGAVARPETWDLSHAFLWQLAANWVTVTHLGWGWGNTWMASWQHACINSSPLHHTIWPWKEIFSLWHVVAVGVGGGVHYSLHCSYRQQVMPLSHNRGELPSVPSPLLGRRLAGSWGEVKPKQQTGRLLHFLDKYFYPVDQTWYL